MDLESSITSQTIGKLDEMELDHKPKRSYQDSDRWRLAEHQFKPSQSGTQSFGSHTSKRPELIPHTPLSTSFMRDTSSPTRELTRTYESPLSSSPNDGSVESLPFAFASRVPIDKPVVRSDSKKALHSGPSIRYSHKKKRQRTSYFGNVNGSEDVYVTENCYTYQSDGISQLWNISGSEIHKANMKALEDEMNEKRRRDRNKREEACDWWSEKSESR